MSPLAPSEGALSPAFLGRLAGIFFLVAGVATAVSLVLPLPPGQDRAAIAAVSFGSVVGGLGAWRAPWPRWPPAAMRWTLAPAALALIAAANYSGGLNPYTADVGLPLVFAWVGLSQPRGTSLRLAAPAAVAYLLPLLAAGRPAGDLFTVALVIPVFVGLGEGCAWVASRLRTAEGEVRAAGAGIERLLEATTALGRADTEAEAAALTADLVMDLLGADRVAVMAAEEEGSSRFVSRGQRHIPVPLGDSVVDAATEPSGTGLAVQGGQTVFVADSRSSAVISPHLSRLVPSASAAFIPLPGEGGFLGAVVVLWDTPRAGLDQFSERAAEVLSGEAGRALERTRATARLAQDLGERRRSEETLRASEERIRAVIETAGDAFIGMDDAGLVTEWNRQAEMTFGWSREEVVGQPVHDLIIPEDLRSAHQAGLRRFLDTGEGAILGRRLELLARARGGHEFPVELTVWSTRVGSTFGLSAFVRDISERKRLEAELIRQTLHDPLTSLPNRTLLLDRLSHALTRAERSHAPVTVLFLDLDGFKTINDSLGHAAGDRLLAAVAARLAGAIRPPDTVARLGGDEFAVLLEDTGTVDGVRVAQRLGQALDAPFDVDGHHVIARASVGVASGNPGEQTADDLLRNADLAMYMAKGQGKAGYAVFEAGMHVAVLERLELEADLRRALGLGELFLLYQPVVRLADASVVGMEALIRWRRAGGDVVSPLQFIPVAEETGLIGEIGRWVLQEACRQAAEWQAEHTPAPALRLSVNLSARQLQDPGLVKDVEAVLAASGLEPECLVIEITESLLMSEPDVAIQRLRDLKDLGVWLAIDDFGTGYSSLSYLRRFPVDVLKIDRSFVTALGGDPEDAALAHAIVKLGHTLQLRIVAEGIETPAQLAELQALECEYGQGYLFARPLTANAMSAVLADAGRGRGLLPPASSPAWVGRLRVLNAAVDVGEAEG